MHQKILRDIRSSDLNIAMNIWFWRHLLSSKRLTTFACRFSGIGGSTVWGSGIGGSTVWAPPRGRHRSSGRSNAIFSPPRVTYTWTGDFCTGLCCRFFCDYASRFGTSVNSGRSSGDLECIFLHFPKTSRSVTFHSTLCKKINKWKQKWRYLFPKLYFFISKQTCIHTNKITKVLIFS